MTSAQSSVNFSTSSTGIAKRDVWPAVHSPKPGDTWKGEDAPPGKWVSVLTLYRNAQWRLGNRLYSSTRMQD